MPTEENKKRTANKEKSSGQLMSREAQERLKEGARKGGQHSHMHDPGKSSEDYKNK